MACTLEELQKTEYEILCRFADFCDEHHITYGLGWGTLLGAIRHDGFIPWDDDVDVNMEIHEFRKLIRCLRKHPIPGFHLSWMDSEPENPFTFAKLRKNTTFMPEAALFLKNIDINNGVWIDIFCYFGAPKSQKLAAVQEKLYLFYRSLSHIIFFKHDPNVEHPLKNTKAFSIAMKLSEKTTFRLRRLLFWLATHMGGRHSKEVIYDCHEWNPIRRLPREYELPVCSHMFWNREFSVPQNYDVLLTKLYGDYMTPKQYPSHTDLESVQL